MRSRLVMFSAIAVCASLALALAFLAFPVDPSAVTHAQTPAVGPAGLPPTGTELLGGSGGAATLLWILATVAGATLLAGGTFLLTRRQRN